MITTAACHCQFNFKQVLLPVPKNVHPKTSVANYHTK